VSHLEQFTFLVAYADGTLECLPGCQTLERGSCDANEGARTLCSHRSPDSSGHE